jgi:hypothetical protein
MWKCDAAQARLETPELVLQIDVNRPQDGIHSVMLSSQGRSAALPQSSLLKVHLAPVARVENVADKWARGVDLVAVYAQSAERPFRSEIYWRALRSESPLCVGVELIVSVQTSLLDALPRLDTSSSLPASEALWIDDPDRLTHVRRWAYGDPPLRATREGGQGVSLLRLEDAPFSYIEMVYPGDFVTASLQGRDRLTTLQWELFPESLEKGVIRRARLRGLFADRDDDLNHAAWCYRDFVTSPIPLTS